MKPHRRKKLGIIIFITLGLSAAVGLTLYALKQNINMFFTPTQVAEGKVPDGQHFRIGGGGGGKSGLWDAKAVGSHLYVSL